MSVSIVPWSTTPVLDVQMDQEMSESSGSEEKSLAAGASLEPPSKKRKLDSLEIVRGF